MREQIRALALLAALILLAGCGKAPETGPALVEPVGVQSDMATASVQDIFRVQLYDAAVSPHVEALSFAAEGRVGRVAVYPGMQVAAGDVLAELDQSAERREAEALRAELAYLERDYACEDELGEIDLALLALALEELKAQGADEKQIALSELAIEEKEASLRQARALRKPEMKAKRQALERLEQTLSQGMLRAPFSGRVAACSPELAQGAAVSANAPLLYLADDSRLSLQCAYIPEITLKAASRVYARIGKTDYELEALPVSHEAYVAALLAGQTPRTEFTVTGPEEALAQLEAGQYAGVCLVLGFVPDALTVPSGAVLHDAGGRYVYVDVNGERVRRAVQVGVVTDALAQITAGLEEGDVVYVRD